MFTINSSASSYCDNYSGIPSFPKTLSWDGNATDCCNWDGVTCDGSTGHVVGLDLSCSWLYGKIHPNSSLSQLSHLQRLNLAYNDFNGSRISYAFGSFARLTHLNLSNSALSGSIPSEISLLSKLISLDLSSSQESQLRLEPLHFKVLLKNLTQLQELALSRVNISSGLPDSIGYLKSLKFLDLTSTSLSGKLPNSIGYLKSLNYLSVGDCRLRGSIPKSLGNLTQIRVLRLRENSFNGEVPSTLSNLKQLTQLELSFNNFKGRIPVLVGLTKLESLSLGYNNFIGGFPLWAANLKPLRYLQMSSNQLTGPIPFNLSGLQNLQELYLYNNSLSGVVPPSLFTLPSLLAIDLSVNYLTGQIPIPPPLIRYFLISNNNLSGEIPSLICDASSLEILDLSYNKLSGTVPQCLGNFSSVLSVLNMHSNGFTGTLPLAFAKPNQLRILDFSSNQFEGPLPRSLANCTSLKVLNVGNNKINDTFPYWLETLLELQVLVVRSNRFHGPINTLTSKFSFPRLLFVDLSHNGFTGYLPGRYFEYFQAMKNCTMPTNVQYIGAWADYHQDSLIGTMKGNEIESVRILNLFSGIDFSCNNFSGEIPNVIGKLYSLHVLNFSHNSLTGHIPASLADLRNLEALDISHNQLTGKIPSQLTSLTFLAVLNLSWNCLEGKIPTDKQFGTFDNWSYVGNLGSCGFPLPPVLQHEEDDSDFDGFTWKIMVIGYGCGMTLGLFLGSLMFLIGRPRFFVKLAERKLPKKVIRLRRTVADAVA